MTAKAYIDYLQLQPHPEGGYYRETYRSTGIIPSHCLEGFDGDRSYATAIYYLLEQGDFSAFHRIKSDECWHFYAGGGLLLHMIDQKGQYSCIALGSNVMAGERFQFVVPANVWFGAEPPPQSDFALVGCTVAPGFDFADFEMGPKAGMLRQFPQHALVINRLCR